MSRLASHCPDRCCREAAKAVWGDSDGAIRGPTAAWRWQGGRVPAARRERLHEAVTRPHGVFEGPARLRTGGHCGGFCAVPSSPAVFLDGAVFMHRLSSARAPTGVGSGRFRIRADSCVLMRGDANRCADACSLWPRPPARKNELFLCTHASGARGRLARAVRRSVGRFFDAVLCALDYAGSVRSLSIRQLCRLVKLDPVVGSSSSGTLKRRSHASLAIVVLRRGVVLLTVPSCRLSIVSATMGRRARFNRTYAAGGSGGWSRGSAEFLRHTERCFFCRSRFPYAAVRSSHSNMGGGKYGGDV